MLLRTQNSQQQQKAYCSKQAIYSYILFFCIIYISIYPPGYCSSESRTVVPLSTLYRSNHEMERQQSCCGYTWSLKVLFLFPFRLQEKQENSGQKKMFSLFFFFLLSLKTLFQVLRAKCKESGIGPYVLCVLWLSVKKKNISRTVQDRHSK